MTRTEQNISECQTENGFDWELFQYLCDIADYFESED